jgi:hypothetical protein
MEVIGNAIVWSDHDQATVPPDMANNLLAQRREERRQWVTKTWDDWFNSIKLLMYEFI